LPSTLSTSARESKEAATNHDPLDLTFPSPHRSEVDLLLGDASKARGLIGWAPAVSFDALVREMVAADLDLVDKGDLQS
jgi:GDP-D-mannose dehydratase